jgi:hypothetical protein
MQNISSIPEARSSKEKRDFWFSHVDAWKASSKSQSQYCDEHGLKLTTFGYWRSIRTAKKSTTPPFFVKMTPKVTASPAASAQERIQIKLANNVVANIPLAIGMKEIIFLFFYSKAWEVMMLKFRPEVEVYVCKEPTDMRKGVPQQADI